MIIKVQESAKKDLKRVDSTNRKRLLSALKKLEDYPNITNVKKLKNYYPPLRYRVGDYRILFDIEDDYLIVVNIKHRKESYKN